MVIKKALIEVRYRRAYGLRHLIHCTQEKLNKFIVKTLESASS